MESIKRCETCENMGKTREKNKNIKMEEKICKNCEYKNSPDAKFCFNCGKNLDENQIENNEKTTNVNSKTNVLAITGLVLGIIGIIIWAVFLAIRILAITVQ